MSNSPATLTRPQRPPFRGGPPVRTTFDGGFSNDPDPEYEIYLESAERLLKSVEGWPGDDLDVLIRLLSQRQKWLEGELWGMRAIFTTSLPPIRGFDLKDVVSSSSSLESRVVRMLNQLNEAILKVNQRILLQKSPFPLT